MNTSQISNPMDPLTDILKMASAQTTDLTNRLIKVNVEQQLQAVKDESIGNVIDMYA